MFQLFSLCSHFVQQNACRMKLISLAVILSSLIHRSTLHSHKKRQGLEISAILDLNLKLTASKGATPVNYFCDWQLVAEWDNVISYTLQQIY